MQFSADNQERIAARQVLGGPDYYPETHTSRNAQMFRKATADTIVNGTTAERFAPPGFEVELDRIRSAVSGNGRFFTGTA